jgi:hypothetical protein
LDVHAEYILPSMMAAEMRIHELPLFENP